MPVEREYRLTQPWLVFVQKKIAMVGSRLEGWYRGEGAPGADGWCSMRPHDGVGAGRDSEAGGEAWDAAAPASLALRRPERILASGWAGQREKREQEWAGLVRPCGLRRWARNNVFWLFIFK